MSVQFGENSPDNAVAPPAPVRPLLQGRGTCSGLLFCLLVMSTWCVELSFPDKSRNPLVLNSTGAHISLPPSPKAETYT